MNSRTSVIIFIIIIIFLVFCLKDDSEDIILKDDENIEISNDFKAYSNDESIYFYDGKGNAILYNFSGDKIIEAFTFIEANSLEQAEEIKVFYMQSLNSGEVEEIITEKDLVTIVYNEEYLKNFENLSRQDFENILFSGE